MAQKGTLKDRMTAAEFKDYNDRANRAAESKYRAIPTETADGQKFRSKLEATFYNRVKLLKQQGEIVEFSREVPFELVVNGFHVCTYVCDFVLKWKDGTVQHIDCKSQPTITPVYRLKKKLMEAVYGIILKEIFE